MVGEISPSLVSSLSPSSQAFQTVDVSTREPRTVVLMLDSPEQAVVCTACQALHKHMEKCERNQRMGEPLPLLTSFLTTPPLPPYSCPLLLLLSQLSRTVWT